MADPYFIGLVSSIYSSAEAALGAKNTPLGVHLAKDGLLKKSTAEKSLDLLDMLYRKTAGNLDDTEMAALLKAQKDLRALIAADEAN